MSEEPEITKYLTLSPTWEEGIHQFEYTDLILGYDAATGQDGVANTPATQLGNRTEYLKDRIGVAHDFLTGMHRLSNVDFADDAAIAEVCLALDFSVSGLLEAIARHRKEVEETRSGSIVRGYANLPAYQLLSRLVPATREYLGDFSMLELFTHDYTAHGPISFTEILDVVAGDDSADVVSTDGLEVDREYMICDHDGSRVEAATVMTVLTDNRVRFTTPLKYRRESGLVTDTNLYIGSGKAIAGVDWAYISPDISAGDSWAFLGVNRDAVTTKATAYYRRSDGIWVSLGAPETREYGNGTADDIWRVPAGATRFSVSYQSEPEVYPYDVHHIFLLPHNLREWVEKVRRPVIRSAYFEGDDLVIESSRYGSLYREPQEGGDVLLRAGLDLEASPRLVHFSGTASRLRIPLDEGLRRFPRLYVQLRHADDLGQASRWSSPLSVVRVEE